MAPPFPSQINSLATAPTNDEIEILNSTRLTNQHANLRQQVHIDPAHRNMDHRCNPTATNLVAADQARALTNSIYQVREIRRERFAAAQGVENSEIAHRDPMLDHREAPIHRTGNFSSALADPQQCGARPTYHPTCGLLQVGLGRLTVPSPPPKPHQVQMNPRVIPDQRPTELPVKMVTLRLFHEAYFHGPKDTNRPSTSRSSSRKATEKFVWNCDKTDKNDTGPENCITIDLNHITPQAVIDLMVGSLNHLQAGLGTYLINVSAPQSVTWLGVSLTPKCHFRDQKYNLQNSIEWNSFKGLADHSTQPSSAGLLAQMANPDVQIAAAQRKEKRGNYLGSWNTQRAVVNNQPSGSAAALSITTENSPSVFTAALKAQLTKNGTEQCRYRDPIDNKKWSIMTPRKIKIWVDQIIAARNDGRTDVDIYTPPKEPAFKTFLNGKVPPGYVEFPNDPPPAGFMALAPTPLAPPTFPLAAPTQVLDDCIYQKKYSGNMEDFLEYAEFLPSDTSLRASLSQAHYTRWSDLKPTTDMNLAELNRIGIPPGDASHLMACAVRYQGFLMAKLAAIDAQQL
ncbi:uncharacterized protein MELLADRAFT_95114 [Melampsora larici-populina 98AG31]|uniref:Uncharacterized protein n=1 Tax=Melampsora larici-populina (strain 98AG31 / pathotype 3-4-7) TaxID=747676 RepID=F4RCQ1_MELLP|nr:uncharacterized protein MELLADRAFT_95114 [Melampsora larici-populina 98AG31]EGG09670.1 hypothetical protein MELLADRAFT_95114 [Melampsora larici-populina 98AG31]